MTERNLNLSKKISYRSRYSSDSNIIDNMNEIRYENEEEKIENEIFFNDKPLLQKNSNSIQPPLQNKLTQTFNENTKQIENIKNEQKKKEIKIFYKIFDGKNQIKNKEKIIQNSSKKMEKNSKKKLDFQEKKFFNPFEGFSSNVPNSFRLSRK